MLCFVLWQCKSDCLSKHNLTGSEGNVLFPLRLLLQWVLCTKFIVLEKKLTAHCLLCPAHLMAGMLLMMQHLGSKFARRCSLVCLHVNTVFLCVCVADPSACVRHTCTETHRSVMDFMTFEEDSSSLSLAQGPLIGWQKEQMTWWDLWCASWEGWRSLLPRPAVAWCSVLSSLLALM